MHLYHGGPASALPSMKKHGIMPRARSKAKSNWTHTVSSNPWGVYTTTCYGWHFAANATNRKKPGVILEVDRDKLFPYLLCPDEDMLEQATRGLGPSKKRPDFAPIEWSMHKRTLHYRRIARLNPHLADASLEGMGTAVYYGDEISWDAVTRYVLIDWAKLDPTMHMQAIDSQVSVLNYSILARRHRAFTKWFFGDETTPAEVAGYDDLIGRLPEGETGDVIKRAVEGFAQAMANREGLEVRDAREEETV